MTWVWIRGYKKRYKVSSTGLIRSYLRRGRLLKTPPNDCGYPVVGLYKNGRKRTFAVHRLVAETFIPNPKNRPEVNHKDGNKENCRRSNLEWVNAFQNVMHAYSLGLRSR